MGKRGWLFDAFIGLLLTAAVFAGYAVPGMPVIGTALESLELKFYDVRSKLRENLDPSQEIRLIVIDDNSIAQLGRYPWPRTRMAALLDRLQAVHPKVIGVDTVYSEPERDAGLDEIRALERSYRDLVASRKLADKTNAFGPLFAGVEDRLASDSKLAASIKNAGSVVLAMFGSSSGVIGAKPKELPPAISSFSVSVQISRDAIPMPIFGDILAYPIVPLAETAAGIGHLNIELGIDGKARKVWPVMRYGDTYLPSFALQVVLTYSGLKPVDAVFSPGREVRLANTAIPLDEESAMLISFNGPPETFRYYPFVDVMNDKVSLDLFKDKIVLVGVTAGGVATRYVTPVGQDFPPIEVTANVIENILHKKFLTRPPWAMKLELGLLAGVGLFIMILLPRFKAFWGAALSFLLLVGILGTGTYFFVVSAQWIKIAYPSVLLVAGYLVIISKRFFSTEKGKELVEASAIETNKMLGLSFQGQGMLDMAFEKFRLCPLDENMKDTLYNLALDFERKRQFSKAAAVLDHIAKTDPKYKDIAEKAKMLKAASEGAVFGGVGAKKEGTVMLSGGSTKPTLGRYEIEKELGRGAMGIVYLGRDPKINRQVAIKTMALEDGGDAAEAKAVKERFFREAESAGTLNHPNIVRIFDAGEEQDVAYIAMELLDGHDFTQFTQKDRLLAPAQAMEYVAQVADAMDYAHSKGIVHRDIKPANIMLLKDGTVRIADFGIARITASSKTATGTVMGTPSYMSPEQVAGKKVDGRSDIFSLTVALYELLCGEKPFKGGEGIGTLLFQIANDPHPDVRSINPAVPACAAAILDKGLAKEPEQRYQKAGELASDLRRCIGRAGETSTAVPAAAPTKSGSELVAELAAKAAPAEERTAPREPGTDEITAPVVEPKTEPAEPPALTIEKTTESLKPTPVTDPDATKPDSLRTLEFPSDATLKLTVPEPPAGPHGGGANPDATIKLTPPEAEKP